VLVFPTLLYPSSTREQNPLAVNDWPNHFRRYQESCCSTSTHFSDLHSGSPSGHLSRYDMACIGQFRGVWRRRTSGGRCCKRKEATSERGRPQGKFLSSSNPFPNPHSILLQFLRGLVEQHTDGYLDELQHEVAEALDKEISITTIWRALSQMEISNKRVGLKFHI
jgi:hypothetical protein